MSRSSMRRSLAVIALAFMAATTVVAAVFAAEAASGSGTMDAKAKVLAKLDDDWSAAAVAKDLDRVASFYAEDAIAYPPNAPAALGREAAKQVWASYLSLPDFTISWKTTHAEVAKSGDLGFTSGTYELSLKGPDGNAVHEKGKYLCTWKKQKDGSWKAIHDMWNSDTK